MTYPTLYSIYLGMLYFDELSSTPPDPATGDTVLATAQRVSGGQLFSFMARFARQSGEVSEYLTKLGYLFVGRGVAVSAYIPISDADNLENFIREVYRYERYYGSLESSRTYAWPGNDPVRVESYRAIAGSIVDWVASLVSQGACLVQLCRDLNLKATRLTYSDSGATVVCPLVNTHSHISTICHLSHDSLYDWFFIATHDSGRHIVRIDAAGTPVITSTDTSAMVGRNSIGSKAVVNGNGILAVGGVSFGGDDYCELFDAHDPANFSWAPLARLDYGAVWVSAVAWQGSRLYTFTGDVVNTNWTMRVYDCSAPSAPVLLSTYSAPAGAGVVRTCCPVGGLVFCTVDTPNPGWIAVDISNLAAVQYLGADYATVRAGYINGFDGYIITPSSVNTKYCRWNLSAFSATSIPAGEVDLPDPWPHMARAFGQMGSSGDIVVAEELTSRDLFVCTLASNNLIPAQDIVKGIFVTEHIIVVSALFVYTQYDTLVVYIGAY